MARQKRKLPALNASSMADISFLLLTFFLLVSSMDTDSGLARRLPPPPQDENVDQSIDVQRRNLLIVMVNFNNETMVASQESTEWYQVSELLGSGSKVGLKDKVKEFVLNTSNSPSLPELMEEDFGAPIGIVPVTKQHVVSLQNDATASYKTYIAVQNELVKAYNELRKEGARKYFNADYEDLADDQKKQIDKLYPQRISEAEPKNYKEGK